MERNCCQNIRNCLVRTDRFLQTKKTSNVIPFSVIRIILIVLEVFCLLQFCDCIPRSIFLICFKTLDFLVEVLSGRTIVREIFFWEILIFGSNPSWRSCYEGKKIAGQSKVDPGVVFSIAHGVIPLHDLTPACDVEPQTMPFLTLGSSDRSQL